MAFFNKKKSAQGGSSSGGKDEEVKPAPAAPAASVPKGGDSHAYRAVFGPHVTEKAAMGNAFGKYVFTVAGTSNKTEIKHAVEKLYKVSVHDVHVLHMPSKKRQVGRHMGTKSGYKKAVVTLRKGDKIDIIG